MQHMNVRLCFGFAYVQLDFKLTGSILAVYDVKSIKTGH